MVYNKRLKLKFLTNPYKKGRRKKKTPMVRRVRNRILAINRRTRKKGDFIQSKYQYRNKIKNVVKTPKVYYYGADLIQIKRTIPTLDSFVLKPNHLSRGIGIRVLTKIGDKYKDINGDILTLADLMDEIKIILKLKRYKGIRAILLEETIRSHPALGSHTLSDIRFLYYKNSPLFCISRIPNKNSGGYGNIIRGAKWGKIIGGLYVNDDRFLSSTITAGKLPFYTEMASAGSKVTKLFGCAFMSVDMTVNNKGEVVVLESESLPQIEYYLTDKGASWLFSRISKGNIGTHRSGKRRKNTLSKYFRGKVHRAK